MVTLANGAISWRSYKQTYIERYSIESEFIALDKVAAEAYWLRGFLEGIPNSENLYL